MLRLSRSLLFSLSLASAGAAAESYVCPVELLDEGLIELKRSGRGFELTHSVLGERNVRILNENDKYFCGAHTDLEGVPTLYLFCVDKADRSISVTMGSPFTDDSNEPQMQEWRYSKCFVNSGEMN